VDFADGTRTQKWGPGAAKAALERAKEHVAPQIRIDPALIEQFGREFQHRFGAFPQGLPAGPYQCH
jgi:hypothetical protein